MRYLLVGILLVFIDTCRAVDNGRCYVSRGYQALEDLNRNKDNPEYSRFCNSTHNGCFAFTGFGEGETYPFDPDHGTATNGTNGTIIDEFDINECRLDQFACSSSECIPHWYLCDGDNDCDDGSDERLDFCMARWSTEEFGRYGCLGDRLRDQETAFKVLFDGFWNRRKSFGDNVMMLEQVFSKGKGKINVALSGVQLTGLVSTDFLAAIGKILRREPLEVNTDVYIKIADLIVKLKLNTFEKLMDQLFTGPSFRLNIEDILDAFDGAFGIIEQSISGDLGATYKKVITWIKWIIRNEGSIINQDRVNAYRGDKINVDVMIKLAGGADNTADVKLQGELTEAFSAFIRQGYFAALNGNVEFCDEEQKCRRLLLCGTDLCNKFEPTKWKASLLAHDCPAGKWKNGLGGCQDCQCSKSGSTGNECNQETGQCNCKPGLIGKTCDKCPPRSIRYIKGDVETPGDFNENQKDCLFCVPDSVENGRPEWLSQFDYDEGCFSCLSIQECKTFEQKGCPAACLNY